MVTVAAAAAASALTWIPPALPVVIGLVILVAGLAWVVLRYRAWGFEVRNDELYLQRGVVTHVRTIAPYVRIQHVDTQRGPLERWLGLSTLVVYTAGSRGADVSIPGLTATEARDLQSRLKQLSIAAEGGDAV
ncbi:MAG: PH domain-containing protein [Salinirussus sp.]